MRAGALIDILLVIARCYGKSCGVRWGEQGEVLNLKPKIPVSMGHGDVPSRHAALTTRKMVKEL
jgi:hypothetical protein